MISSNNRTDDTIPSSNDGGNHRLMAGDESKTAGPSHWQTSRTGKSSVVSYVKHFEGSRPNATSSMGDASPKPKSVGTLTHINRGFNKVAQFSISPKKTLRRCKKGNYRTPPSRELSPQSTWEQYYQHQQSATAQPEAEQEADDDDDGKGRE